MFNRLINNLISILLGYVFPFLLLFLLYVSNIILFPFTRIPISKNNKFELPVALKALHIACIYRDSIEEVTGNRLLFFSRGNDISKPFYLYIRKKDLNRLPQNLLKFKTIEEAFKKNKTVIVTVEARKSLLCGYLPANILSYKIINKKPEFIK